MKDKVTITWSKRERDWLSKYTESNGRNGRILGNNFFTMIEEFERWKGEKLRDVISNAGFDHDTFTISVKAKN